MSSDIEVVIYEVVTEGHRAEFNRKYSNLLLNNRYKATDLWPIMNTKRKLGSEVNIFAVLEKGYLNPEYNFTQLKQIGERSEETCRKFYNEISSKIMEFYELPLQEKLIEYKRQMIEKLFGQFDIPEDVIWSNSYYDFVAFGLRNPIFFSLRDTRIYLELLWIFSDVDELLHYPELAKKFGITTERVRQLGHHFFKLIGEKFKEVDQLGLDLYENELVKNRDVIYYDYDSIDKKDIKSLYQFNPNFITFILSYHLEDYSLVGGYKNYFLGIEYSNRNTWNCLYLVSSLMVEVFNFEGFVNSIYTRINARVTEDYELDIKEAMEEFCLTESMTDTMRARIIKVLKTILNIELSLQISESGTVTIERNTMWLLWEYVYAALESLDKPSYLNEIQDELKVLYPLRSFNTDSIRSSMINNDAFIHVGRKSMYALTRWEDEKESFKGGTIRDIVAEFLEKEGGPQHIDAITEYVLIYRPETTRDKIYSNLSLESHDRFIVPEPGYVDLGKDAQ